MQLKRTPNAPQRAPNAHQMQLKRIPNATQMHAKRNLNSPKTNLTRNSKTLGTQLKPHLTRIEHANKRKEEHIYIYVLENNNGQTQIKK